MIKILLSKLYNLGLNLWYLYDEVHRTKDVLPAHVISVGNLTTGGTGKTPLTIFIAQKLSIVEKKSQSLRGATREKERVYTYLKKTHHL